MNKILFIAAWKSLLLYVFFGFDMLKPKNENECKLQKHYNLITEEYYAITGFIFYYVVDRD